MYTEAQDSVIQCNDSAYCVPSVSGLPRSKGIIVERLSALEHGLTTRNTATNDRSQADIGKNRIYNIKARGPIVNTPQLKLVLGASVTIEEFEFDDAETLTDPLLISLQDRALRTAGVDLYSLKSFRSNKYLVSRLQTRLNGDFDSGNGRNLDYLRIGFVSVLGWKLDEHRVIGFGAAFSHIYGRASILPVMIYYNSFHPKWGLEANLPANARLRYSPDPKHFFYAGAEIRGANYRLDPTAISVPYILEKSELDLGFNFEKDLYDWLWMGLKLGYRTNLSLEVSSSQQLSFTSNDRLLETDVDNSIYYGLSIFLVAPKKMLKQ